MEMLKKSRDSRRLTELGEIDKALKLYSLSGGTSWGSSNTVYVSIPDTSPTCSNLGLPSLPTGWSYSCRTEADYRKVDGNGWIPVNFTSISQGTPFSVLPTDPVNSAAAGNYYTYVSGGSYAVSGLLESEKYLKQSAVRDGGTDDGRFELGNDLNLWTQASGLVGYWKFDEGSGATALDSSGNNNTGTMYSSSSQANLHISSGCQVGGCASFDGSDDYVQVPYSASLNLLGNNETVLLYVKHNSSLYIFFQGNGWSRRLFGVHWTLIDINSVYYEPSVSGANNNQWHLVGYTVSGTNLLSYLDGLPKDTKTLGANIRDASSYWRFGRSCSGSSCDVYYQGLIDEVRIYKRALSAPEIKAIYEANK
jgi:hypothetical protein